MASSQSTTINYQRVEKQFRILEQIILHDSWEGQPVLSFDKIPKYIAYMREAPKHHYHDGDREYSLYQKIESLSKSCRVVPLIKALRSLPEKEKPKYYQSYNLGVMFGKMASVIQEIEPTFRVRTPANIAFIHTVQIVGQQLRFTGISSFSEYSAPSGKLFAQFASIYCQHSGALSAIKSLLQPKLMRQEEPTPRPSHLSL